MFQRRQTFLHAWWFTVLVVSSFGNAAYAERPNILLIYLDDFGWKDAGYMGSDFYETPQIDALARNGMIFTNAYSCASNCAPARACLMSGQYTPRHKIYNVGTGARGKPAFRRLQHVPGVQVLDKKIRTWAHQLQTAGYATATIGKWHLSSIKDSDYTYDTAVDIVKGCGFDYVDGLYIENLNREPDFDNYSDGSFSHNMEWITSEAIQFIKNAGDDPFFLYFNPTVSGVVWMN